MYVPTLRDDPCGYRLTVETATMGGRSFSLFELPPGICTNILTRTPTVLAKAKYIYAVVSLILHTLLIAQTLAALLPTFKPVCRMVLIQCPLGMRIAAGNHGAKPTTAC